MSRRPWLGAIRTATGGILRHKVQATVIGVVLLISTASATLGFALLAASNAPFQSAFSSQHGAHVTVTANPAHASPAELAATRTLGGVTATAGPFAAATVAVQYGGQPFGQLILAGRPSPGGPVDDVVMNAGHWPDAPGQVVLDGTAAPGGNQGPGQGGPQVGSTLTVTGPRGTGRGRSGRESHHGHAHRRRFRQLHHEHRGRLGHRGRGHPAAGTWRAGQRADDVPVHPGRHLHADPRRRGQGDQGAAAGQRDRGRLLAQCGERRHRERRDHGAVRRRLRADRPGHGGAHRGQRGQRGGRRRLLPDRRAEEPWPHPGPGRDRLPEPGRLAGRGRMPGRRGRGERAGGPGAARFGRRLRRGQPAGPVVGLGRRAGS